MSQPAVNFELVKKKMLDHKRCVYYLEDGSGNVLGYNEEDIKPEEAVSQLESDLTEINGTYVFIRIHAKVPGANQRGGKQEPTFRYKIMLNDFRNDNRPQRGNAEQNFSPGSLGLFERFFSKINELEVKLTESKYEMRIKELEDKLKEGNGKDLLIDKVINKVIELDNIKTATKAPAQAPGVPIADNVEKQHKAESKKVIEALKKFASIDADYMNNLDLLADYAQRNPQAYKAVINQIKNAQ